MIGRLLCKLTFHRTRFHSALLTPEMGYVRCRRAHCREVLT